jgi:hypothetical protein
MDASFSSRLSSSEVLPSTSLLAWMFWTLRPTVFINDDVFGRTVDDMAYLILR